MAGAVSTWEMAAEIATAIGGRIPRQDLIAGAIALAGEGIPVTHSFKTLAAENLDALAPTHGFAAHYLVDGKVPEIGARLKAERLTDTLEHLARAGFADFYRGDIAAEIAADLEAAGSPVTRADLKAQRASLVTPLSVDITDATLFNMPPPTQGVASLIILGLFDRLKVKRAESFEHIHGLIEATKRAWVIRDREVADPLFSGDLKPYLEPAWLDAEAEQIDMRRASPYPPGDPKGDTVWMGAIDRDGLAVSMIQSIYFEFGSGVVLPRTGIVWQNRGVGFSLDPARTARWRRGESRSTRSTRRSPASGRPHHDLRLDGRRRPAAVPGGDLHPLPLGAEPRRCHRPATLALGPDLGRRQPLRRRDGESPFDPDLLIALERAGHELYTLDQPYANAMGHAGRMIRPPPRRPLPRRLRPALGRVGRSLLRRRQNEGRRLPRRSQDRAARFSGSDARVRAKSCSRSRRRACAAAISSSTAPPAGAAALGLGKLSEPIIAGHEPCGVVVAVGPGVSERQAKVGMRVMEHHYRGCGVCKHCTPAGRSSAEGVAGLRRDRARRARRLHEGAGAHAGAAARRTVVRGRRRDLLRHRHRLRRPAPARPAGRPHDRHLRPGPGRPVGDASSPARWARA